jgi:hypothetical protein
MAAQHIYNALKHYGEDGYITDAQKLLNTCVYEINYMP